VFAAVCALLAALGHITMSGSSVPWWALAVGAVGTGGAGWCLAGRERGLRLIVSVVTATQGVLHVGFSLAQSAATTSTSGMDVTGAMPMRSMGHDMESMDMGSTHAHSMPMPSMGISHASHTGLDSVICLVRCLSGGHSLGMYAQPTCWPPCCAACGWDMASGSPSACCGPWRGGWPRRCG
jgi:hypothetical protein